MTPELGQPVDFVSTLERRHRHDPRPYFGRREWSKQNAWITTGRQAPVSGIIVGIRTISNGTVGYSEDGTTYTPDEHFTAYLVAYDVRRSPVLVHPDTIIERSN